jgi:hypothetical protein
MNIFQSNYDTRLRSWYELRKNLEHSDLQTKCITIDKWWQNAPLITHHLHPFEIENWPDPWELLVENTYCTVARGLGMCYTLLLMDVHNIEFVLATDNQGNDVVLVMVDHAKYVMNYWPDTVVNNYLQDFRITSKLDINKIIKKIG